MSLTVKKYSVLSLGIALSLTLTTPITLASDKLQNVTTELVESESYLESSEHRALVTTYKQLFRKYERQSLGLVKTVRIFTKAYPEHVIPITTVAFEEEPRAFRHIIRAAIHADPALTPDIVVSALYNKSLHSQSNFVSEVVKTAISAEPAYIDDIVYAAADVRPDKLEDIVRVAVQSDPDMTTTVLQSVNDDNGFVTTAINKTIKALPALGNYLLEAMKSVIPSAKQDPKELESLTENLDLAQNRSDRILKGALQAGISTQEVERAAEAAGINTRNLDTLAAEMETTTAN